MLDLALARAEGVAELVDVVLGGQGGELGLELRAEGRLLLGDELRAHVRPRGGVGRLDRQLGGGEVADFNLRFH